MVSACATSMPTETTGRRNRRPMPTEYMSGSPKLSNALPASVNTATAKFFGRSRTISTEAATRCLPPTFSYTGLPLSSRQRVAVLRRWPGSTGDRSLNAEPAHAVIAAGEKSLRGREVAGLRQRGGAEVAAQQYVPLWRHVEDAFGLHADLQEVRIRTQSVVRAAQFRVQSAAEQRFTEIVARHQREADARDQQRLRVLTSRGDELGFGVQQLDVGHALPVVAEPRAANVREAWREIDGAIVDVADAACVLR